LLFHLISKLYERASLIVTTSLHQAMSPEGEALPSFPPNAKWPEGEQFQGRSTRGRRKVVDGARARPAASVG